MELTAFRELLVCAELDDEHGLLWSATHAVVARLGEHGSCVLVDGSARLVVSTSSTIEAALPVDLGQHPEILSALDQRRLITLGSTVAVPLVVGERRLGALTVQGCSVDELTVDAITTAELIAGLTAQLLDAIRLRSAARGDRSSSRQRGASLALALATWAQPEAPPLLVAAPTRARRVLVVEDELSHALVISAMLEDGGYEVELAANGPEGLECARRAPPDMIVLDVRLPMLDGPQVAEELRRDPLTQHIPILFVSGCEDLSSRACGMDFVAKPIYGPELLMRVERLL